MRFLVFATDVLPRAGLPTSGSALRTHGLVEGLRAHGHEVTVSVPRDALRGLLARLDRESLDPATRGELRQLEETAFDFRNQTALVQALDPDAVLCGHWPAVTFQSRISPPLVIDLAGPYLLERHFQGMPDHAGAVLGKLRALSLADLFVVSGARQRLYFLSFLLRAGVERPETRTLTLPMPLSPDVPSRACGTAADAAFPRFVFGGLFLPWQDPRLALDTAAAVLAERRRGTLTLIGGSHPHYPLPPGVYSELFTRLSEHPFVRRLPLLPYPDFLAELAGADVALDLMRWNLERELALTVRSATYLWSGLPLIYNDYADLAGLVRAYDAGWTVSPSDPHALRSVLDAVFDDPEAVARKGSNASRLAREVFSWDRAVAPLLEALQAQERGPRREIDIELICPDDATMAVLADRPLEQRFLSRINGLSRVECCLAAHRRSGLRDITLSLYRLAGDPSRSPGARELLAARTVPGDAIQDNQWLALEVPPLPDSAGGTFALALESKAVREDESVSPWVSAARPFPLLDLYRAGLKVAGRSLCLRVFSQAPSGQG